MRSQDGHQEKGNKKIKKIEAKVEKLLIGSNLLSVGAEAPAYNKNKITNIIRWGK
jgi:hypothetical protein